MIALGPRRRPVDLDHPDLQRNSGVPDIKASNVEPACAQFMRKPGHHRASLNDGPGVLSRPRRRLPSASATHSNQRAGSSNLLPWCEPPGDSGQIAALWTTYAPTAITRCPHMHHACACQTAPISAGTPLPVPGERRGPPDRGPTAARSRRPQSAREWAPPDRAPGSKPDRPTRRPR